MEEESTGRSRAHPATRPRARRSSGTRSPRRRRGSTARAIHTTAPAAGTRAFPLEIMKQVLVDMVMTAFLAVGLALAGFYS